MPPRQGCPNQTNMSHLDFDLAAAARQEMIDEGFDPDFPPGTTEQLAALAARPPSAAGSEVRDLRSLLWSSIDNDTSRDLDQAEVAERVSGGIRVFIAVADVDVGCARRISHRPACVFADHLGLYRHPDIFDAAGAAFDGPDFVE